MNNYNENRFSLSKSTAFHFILYNIFKAPVYPHCGRYLFSGRSIIFWQLSIKNQQPYKSNFTGTHPITTSVTHLAMHNKFCDVIEVRPLNRNSPIFYILLTNHKNLSLKFQKYLF